MHPRYLAVAFSERQRLQVAASSPSVWQLALPLQRQAGRLGHR
jgi:hypothetical protein